MKTIFNIAISIALGCSCASCSDFLNLTPYSDHRRELLPERGGFQASRKWSLRTFTEHVQHGRVESGRGQIG